MRYLDRMQPLALLVLRLVLGAIMIGLLGPGGYEFPLALASIAFSLIFFGGGPIAVDAIRGVGRGTGSGRSKNT